MKIRVEDQYYMDEIGDEHYRDNTSRKEEEIYQSLKNEPEEYAYLKEDLDVIIKEKEDYKQYSSDSGFSVFLQISDEENDYNRHPYIRSETNEMNETNEGKGHQDDFKNAEYYKNISDCNNCNDSMMHEYAEEKFDSRLYNTCENIDMINHNRPISGCITVVSKLGNEDGIELKGAKINLYKLNGVSPILCASELTDCNGRVIFDNLENGCYRVISIVDRRYFEKPCYIKWNEVTIDCNNRNAFVLVVNKIKPCYYRA